MCPLPKLFCFKNRDALHFTELLPRAGASKESTQHFICALESLSVGELELIRGLQSEDARVRKSFEKENKTKKSCLMSGLN